MYLTPHRETYSLFYNITEVSDIYFIRSARVSLPDVG